MQGELFPPDYESSRTRFRDVVQSLGGEIHSQRLTNADGDSTGALNIDIALLGERNAPRKVVHLAGVHGVEGFAGSAVQSAILSEFPHLPSGLAVVLVHCFNPWGMSNLRRANQNNVDLNRNCVLPPHERVGAPAGYEQVRDLISPRVVQSFPSFALRAVTAIALHGFSALKQAITGGQFVDPSGLWYGGDRMQPEIDLWRQWIAHNLRDTEHLVVLDLHTGLGAYGEETLLIEYSRESDEYRRIVSLFGPERVQAPDTAGAINYSCSGALCHLFPDALPATQVDYVVQEFGTYHALQVLHALISENTEHQHGRAGPGSSVARKLKEAFCPESHQWRQGVVDKGRALFTTTLHRLSE